jgi:NADPH2:quinone reductase
MQAIQFSEYGEPGVLRLVELPTPQPGRREALVRIESAGVNYADTARRRNRYLDKTPLPFVLGGEIAGVVEQVGEGVENVRVGDRVTAVVHQGAYAQYAVVPALALLAIPEGIDDDVATTLLVQGLTGWLIFRGTSTPLTPGESVAIQGAAGGVGSQAVQIAKLLGASPVIALAGSQEKCDFACSLGADIGIDYTQPEWPERVRETTGGKGADVILEIAGGDAIAQDLKALAPWGRLVVYGNASRTPSTLDPIALMHKNHTVLGFWLSPYFLTRRPQVLEGFAALSAWIREGKLNPHIGLRLPLAEAAQAHTLLESRATMGKVVLKPWQ